jgi:L-lactate dehydrogenase complex protein LldG
VVGAQDLSSARERILSAIHEAVPANERQAAAPVSGDDGLLATAPSSVAEMSASFFSEVQSLGGTVTIVDGEAACADAIRDYVRQRGVSPIVVQSSPLAKTIGSLLAGLDVVEANEVASGEVERASLSLLEAVALLADTGSAVVVATNRQDRLLPYLPRACLVVSETRRLQPSLSSSVLALIEEASRTGAGGEAVIVTGPSRTADIEKVLVLGAHGPADLAIFLINVAADRA